MAISVPLRHELKFFINPLEYEVLRRVLDRTRRATPTGTKTTSIIFDRCILTRGLTTL